MGFVCAIKSCFANYATFSGRACRSEYWYFTLFIVLISMALQVLAAVLPPLVSLVVSLASLATLVPSIAVTVRRLHDVDRSGWWYLIILVPLVGAILLLVWFCKKGTDGANRFGGDPLPAAIALQPSAA